MAAKHKRLVAIDGRSLVESTERAQELGYLNIPPHTLHDLQDLKKRRDRDIVIVATGSQGESGAALGRMALGRHRQIQIKEGDTVILSSRVIPGNEIVINRAMNRLFQRGANVIQGNDVHVSGHASQEELKLFLNLLRPKYFLPVHGELQHLHAHARLARNQGIPNDHIKVVENGTVVEVSEAGLEVLDRIPGGYLFVDGNRVGDIGRVVLRDREILSENGFILAVVRIKGKRGLPASRPEIITRGFIYIRENTDLIEQAQQIVMDALPAKNPQDAVRKALADFVERETGRQPMVLPVIIED